MGGDLQRLLEMELRRVQVAQPQIELAALEVRREAVRAEGEGKGHRLAGGLNPALGDPGRCQVGQRIGVIRRGLDDLPEQRLGLVDLFPGKGDEAEPEPGSKLFVHRPLSPS